MPGTDAVTRDNGDHLSDKPSRVQTPGMIRNKTKLANKELNDEPSKCRLATVKCLECELGLTMSAGSCVSDCGGNGPNSYHSNRVSP